MRAIKTTTISILAIGLLAGSAVGVAAQESDVDPRVLFVGHRYTSIEDIPSQVAALVASSDPPELIVAEQSTGGHTSLSDHETRSAPVIRDGDYDIVVLQGSVEDFGLDRVEPFLDAVRALDDVAQASGARSVVYMTWPVEAYSFYGDLDTFIEAHREVEAELGLPVAPVGVAMDNALAERPDLAMLGPDEEHQSPHGAYLAAATIYATLFDQSPEGLPYRSDDVSPEEASFLQRVAWETLQAWQAGTRSPAE